MSTEVWARLSLPEPLLAALLDRWAEGHRRYHDLRHLRAVLRHVDTLAGHAADPDLVRLAAYYHDAVHQGKPDDEEASARLAETDLAAHLPAGAVAEVARLVRLTKGHRTEPGDTNGEVLCDADLAILAATPEDYDAYARAVRFEYAHVPDEAFHAGRAVVLRGLLDLPSLYRTPLARSRWDARARRNLKRELGSLTPSG
ncbi:HD domain-containing protein [Actinokineospora sp. PR83]|uniref:HD domain-containing protein n=1 Tax=Actinokineospora sp. PR83 TaxID=2884908 RepID=UPI001F272257|nr:HD domain-containing protein [Actinokineospora sp. PR83]MCG8920524.1 HD domain-containing protein [Actinokineospora sp. PR83]